MSFGAGRLSSQCCYVSMNSSSRMAWSYSCGTRIVQLPVNKEYGHFSGKNFDGRSRRGTRKKSPAACSGMFSDPRQFDCEDPRTWPVHTTGAAIDLTLHDLGNGKPLDIGTHFNKMLPASHSDHFERILNAGLVATDDIRLRNHRLLYCAIGTGDLPTTATNSGLSIMSTRCTP